MCCLLYPELGNDDFSAPVPTAANLCALSQKTDLIDQVLTSAHCLTEISKSAVKDRLVEEGMKGAGTSEISLHFASIIKRRISQFSLCLEAIYYINYFEMRKCLSSKQWCKSERRKH